MSKQSKESNDRRFKENAADSVVQVAKALHSLSDTADVGSALVSRKDRQRLGRVGRELTDLFLSSWRDSIERSKHFDPQHLRSLFGTGARACADDALYPSDGALFFNADKAATASVTLENRSAVTHDLIVPRYMELWRGDKRWLVDLKVVPAAPVLGPGDVIPLTLTLARVDKPGKSLKGGLTGEITLRSRAGASLTLGVVVN